MQKVLTVAVVGPVCANVARLALQPELTLLSLLETQTPCPVLVSWVQQTEEAATDPGPNL